MRFYAKEVVMKNEKDSCDGVVVIHEIDMSSVSLDSSQKVFDTPLSEEDLRVTTMELPSLDADFLVLTERRIASKGAIFIDDAYPSSVPNQDGNRPRQLISQKVKEKFFADLDRLIK